MKSEQGRVSFCSRCRFYTPQGRRGGQCSQLGVPVESRWTPCPLAVPVFMSPLVAMQPLDFLSQPSELSFSEVSLEAALLEVSLGAPSVPGHSEDALQPAHVRGWR